MYSYVHGDPINRSDPSGLCSVSPDGNTFVSSDLYGDTLRYLALQQDGLRSILRHGPTSML